MGSWNDPDWEDLTTGMKVMGFLIPVALVGSVALIVVLLLGS